MSVLDELIGKLTGLPDDARKQILAAAEAATAGMKWIPNPGPQTDAYFHPADVLLYGGQGGGGKGFRRSQKVLTPFGWRPLSALSVGSVICGTDGTAQRIIAYHERGIQPLYLLKWSDGSETVCDSDHIWLGWVSGSSRKVANKIASGASGAIKWTTKDIAGFYARETGDRLAIPVMSAPCVFNVHGENRGRHKHISREIPPYVLGVLLGDGSIGRAATFTSADPEIAGRCEAAFGDGAVISRYSSETRCDAYRIPNALAKGHLADLGLLGTSSATKFIPRIYLLASIEERWELLRGLMDTDGWAEDDGDCYYTSISRQLAEDVRHLARSLGAIVTWREKVPTYHLHGERREGQLAYTLRIKMPEADRMFSLERKAARCRGKQPQSMAIYLESIEPYGQDETVCITVSNPNSLFVTEDFIVTHNSDLGLGLAFTAHQRSLILRRKYANLGSLTERALEINTSRDGYNGSPPPLLRTADGRYIQFAGNQHLGDEQDWQGQPFDFKCVGRETPVLMADGSYRAIHAVHVGDMVQTLEGARRVNKVWPVRRDEAVRLTVRDAGGAFVCSQDQSLTHEVLTHDGWESHDKCGEASRPSTSRPIQSSVSRKLSELFARPCGEFSRPLQYLWSGLRRICEGVQGSQARAGWMAFGAFAAQQLPVHGGATSCGLRQGPLRLRGSSGSSMPLRLNRALCADSGSLRTSGFHGDDVRSWSGLRDYRESCSSGRRRYDERVRTFSGLGFEQDGDLAYPQQPVGVGQPSPICFADDGRGRTPTHTAHTGTYNHPYTRETRSVAQGVSLQSLTFETCPIGEIELYDIEVDEVNHFITHGGVINKNCFDEATQFLELQIRFHIGWIRTTLKGQRCRALLATNPPVDADGDWIIGMFRPWLDLTHPKPAKHGELRWYVTAPDGTDFETEGPEPIQLPGATGPAIPMSRSFIPAALKDNPYLIDTGYQAKLDGLPEPIRSAVRDGNFMAARADDDYQVIPTQWIIEAQNRWKPDGYKGLSMTAAALDIGAGRDETVLALRYGGWYAPLECVTGEAARDPAHAAALCVKHRRDGCPVVVDVGGGFGGASLVMFKENGIACAQFNGAGTSTVKTKDGTLSFANKRAEAWWRFREELDPNQPGGSAIALPPDPQLRSDLAAPTWKLTTRGILLESKDDIKKRIGRSPDRGDACVMALSEGSKAAARALGRRSGFTPKVVMADRSSIRRH